MRLQAAVLSVPRGAGGLRPESTMAFWGHGEAEQRRNYTAVPTTRVNQKVLSRCKDDACCGNALHSERAWSALPAAVVSHFGELTLVTLLLDK